MFISKHVGEKKKEGTGIMASIKYNRNFILYLIYKRVLPG